MRPFWKRAARMSSEVANMVVMGGCRNASSDSLKNASSRSSCGGCFASSMMLGLSPSVSESDAPQPSVHVIRHAQSCRPADSMTLLQCPKHTWREDPLDRPPSCSTTTFACVASTCCSSSLITRTRTVGAAPRTCVDNTGCQCLKTHQTGHLLLL